MNYKEKLTSIADEASKKFEEYINLTAEAKNNYEKLINYEREKIVTTTGTYSSNSYIYCLYDPTEISKSCYIGISDDADYRLERHIKGWDGGSIFGKKKTWIRELSERKVEPSYIIVDIVDIHGPWQIYESFYIAYYKHIGIDLLNNTIGGDGCVGYKHNDESRELMKQAKLGLKQSDETKEKRMRQDLLEAIEHIKELYLAGYSLNDIAELYDTSHSIIGFHLEKANIQLREEKHTERSIERIRIAQIGKIFSDETKQKMSKSQIGHPTIEETREKISTTRKELISGGVITMPINRANGLDSGNYRLDVLDEDLLNDYKANISLREIGRKYDMEHHAIKNRLITLGIKFDENKKKDTSNFVFDLQQALTLHKAGQSCNKIGKTINCDSKVVKKHLEKAGIVFEKAFNSKVNLDSKMDIIKDLYDRGFNFTEIAHRMKTSGQTIKTYLKKYNVVE